MEDNNNLPFGTSPFDAQQAGVNSWDDSHTAWAKVQTFEMGKRFEAERAWRDAEDASQATSGSYKPAYSNGVGNVHAAPRGSNLPGIRRSNIMTVSHLVQTVESPRREHEIRRAKSTQMARKLRSLALVLAAVLLAIVVLGIKLPFVPYRYGLAEYLAERLMLVACIFAIFKTSSFIRKAYSPDEKRLDDLARCLFDAVKSSYDVKTRTSNNDISRNSLWGRNEVPQKDLTARFLHEFNQRVLRATGAPMQYEVYRFKEFWERAFFIPPGNVLASDIVTHCDRVSLKDLEQLAAQGG